MPFEGKHARALFYMCNAKFMCGHLHRFYARGADWIVRASITRTKLQRRKYVY